MYNNVLQGINHVAIWPVISFIIFFLFFLILLWWVFTADRNMIERMRQMPFDEASPDHTPNNPEA
ncbi:MAG: CcoQ/FixQ family Cbb3-type cytochrome c oxidase assembly chaperone [Bacteroidetes bacterium]|nr:CcoQ/FixQ family Cbb3-type cytochrome c oxidase assembly chaperone [Bacteroidota bacterium]MBS1976776.1 CcoQ/FixQ family Cbb3-type cytochrome c oxidase assembly chaperone [Bacteroidota bacterium]